MAAAGEAGNSSRQQHSTCRGRLTMMLCILQLQAGRRSPQFWSQKNWVEQVWIDGSD
jgi:hypothetical protein